MANANIKAVITADDRASSTLKHFGDNAHSMAGNIAKGVAAAGIAAAAVTAGVVAFGVSSVKSFQESEESLAQLNAVLKSTGGVAGVTADEAVGLADALQKVTKYSDEDVISAQNLLLTFTKIGKDIFPQATKTVLDMSTALGQDTKASAIQLGKALQDPILGITALRRVGVNFSDAQKDVIQGLVDTGKSAEAQKMILAELATEFGGSAEAAGKTFGGRLEILRNQFDEVKERIGAVLVEAITPLAERLANFVATEEFRVKVQQLTDWLAINLPIAIARIEEFVKSVDWKAILDATVLIIQAFAFMAEQIAGTVANIKSILSGVEQFFGLLVFKVQQYLQNIGFGFQQWGIVLSGVANGIANAFRSAFASIVSAWNNTVGRINIKMPDWIPGVGGKGFQAPRFASGTSFAPGGLATVGEQGKEQVILPRGSQVVPNNSVREPAGATINVTVQAGAFMGNQQDARRYAQLIADALKDVASMKGTTVGSMLG